MRKQLHYFLTSLTTRLKIPLTIGTIIASPLFLPLAIPGVAQADTACTPGPTPPPANIALTGSSWLNGGGVNVCNNGSPATNTWGTNYVGSVESGAEWQCVELVNRLYLTKGWITATWKGDGDTLINNVPAGLTEENNGAISYLNTGDVITLGDGTTGTSQDDGGHAAIINTVGSSIGIINQNAQLNSSAYIASGSLSGKNATMDMNAWVCYYVQAVVHAPSPNIRIGEITSGGSFKVKEGGVSTQWHDENDSATQASLSGSLIGVVSAGSFYVKQGNLDGQWTGELSNVVAGVLSDASGTNPMRIGAIDTNGELWVKEGSLSAQWVDEGSNVVTAYLSGTRIGALTSNGTLYVKDGDLSSQWTIEDTGVSQASLSGQLIGEVKSGTFNVKQGGLSAQWTGEYSGASAGYVSDATYLTDLRIGVLTTSGAYEVKEGNLSSQWVAEDTGTSQGVLSGGLTGEVNNGTYNVKQGSLSSQWTAEDTSSTTGLLWSL